MKFFPKPFDLRQFKKGLFDPQVYNYKDSWNTLVLENHDNPRSVSRFGIDDKHYRYEAATMLATITYMGFGIPFIYMGQEVGLTNCRFKTIDDLKDPVSHFVYDMMTGYHMPKSLAFKFIKYGARDHARVPMSWDDSINGGFNEGHETWQCVDEDYKTINVKKDLESDKSIYRFYQKVLKLKKEDLFTYGEVKEYDHENKKIVAYSREYKGKKAFVVGNFSKKEVTYRLPELVKSDAVLINNYEDLIRDGQTIKLKPYQALVFEG